jgi:hypothetical protein
MWKVVLMEFWETHIRKEFLFSKYRNNLKFLFGKRYVRILRYYVILSDTKKTNFGLYFLLSDGRIIVKPNQTIKGTNL